MRDILIATILVFCFFSLIAAQKKSEREKDGLADAVHILRTWKAPLVKEGGRYVEKLRMPWMPARTYGVNGSLLEELIYEADGSVSYKKLFSYDANGNETAVAEYDRYGHHIRKHVTVYGKDGNVIENSLYEADGALNSRITYKYDSEGQKSYYQGQLERKKTINRDTKGNKVEVSEPVGSSYGARDVNTYDSKGNLIDSATYHIPDGSFISRIGTPRDAAGNILAVIGYNADGSEDGRDVITYDGSGNSVEVSHVSANGSLMGKETYSREFDSHGNWIKEIRSVCNASAKPAVCEPMIITYRKITYY